MKDYIKSYAQEVNSKFRRLSHLVQHNLSIGTYHEIVIRQILEKFLSKRCGVKTGFVLNRKSNAISKQIDILVIDENEPTPYYFSEGEFVVAKPESVILGIEIKTTLNQNQFVSAVNNCASFVDCGVKKPFYIFGYTSEAKQKETLSNWYREIDSSYDIKKYYPFCIFILDQGAFHVLSEKFAENWGHYKIAPAKVGTPIDLFVMSYFISSVIKSVEAVMGKNTDPFTDLEMEDSFVEQLCYRFGLGSQYSKVYEPKVSSGYPEL